MCFCGTLSFMDTLSRTDVIEQSFLKVVEPRVLPSERTIGLIQSGESEELSVALETIDGNIRLYPQFMWPLFQTLMSAPTLEELEEKALALKMKPQDVIAFLTQEELLLPLEPSWFDNYGLFLDVETLSEISPSSNRVACRSVQSGADFECYSSTLTASLACLDGMTLLEAAHFTAGLHSGSPEQVIEGILEDLPTVIVTASAVLHKL